MLPYFPPAYPDELLYSLLARFHRHVCETSPKRTLDVLFGNRSVRAGVALQGHLQALSERLPPPRELTPERLLADFTLYPYLTAFQPKELRLAVRDALFFGHVEWVYVRLGLAASRVQGATALRYCPVCRSAMMAQYGELFWRRDHQLPAITVCPEHGVRMRDSAVRPGAVGQHSFIAADEDNCPEMPPDAVGESSLQWVVAKRCARLLTSLPEPKSIQEWGEHYHRELRLRGFGKGNDRIDQRRLSQGGKLIGRFACSCGYVFSLAATPTSKPRVLDLGPLFQQRLQQLAAEQVGLRAAARALCVDPGTVRRHAERLGMDVPWVPLKPRPHVSRSRKVSPVRPSQRKPAPRRDWLVLDGQLCSVLLAEAEAALGVTDRRLAEDWAKSPPPPLPRIYGYEPSQPFCASSD